MKSFSSLAAVALLASTVSAQFTINSLASVVVCRPSLITWTGGVPPYFLSILPGGQPSAAPLVDLGQQNGTSVTWLVNLGAGTSAFLNLVDQTGALAQSAPFTPIAGTNTSCVTETVSQSQGTPAGTPANTGSTPASTTGSLSTTGTGTGTGSATTKNTGTASPSPTSAAISKYAGAGAIAVIGSAILAIAI